MTDAPLKDTPLFEVHKRLGGRMVPFAGYRMPVQYEGVVKEHQAVRTAAGLFDVSHMGELRFRGPSAIAAVDALVTNHVAKLANGRALYTACCNEAGAILDDLLVYRVADDEVLVVCNASNLDKIRAHFAAHVPADCTFEDESEHTALLALQGPKAFDILKAMGAPEVVLELRPFAFTHATLASAPVMVARTGYTGEDGVEIYVPNAQAVPLFEAIMAAGEAFGLKPAGLGARDTLRLEAKLALYGNDIDETTHPFEAGLGWVVKLKKGEFMGSDALAKAKADGLHRKLVGFEMTGRGIARHGYPIVDASGEKIGIVTSGSPSPTLGKNIGLGYVPIETSEVGSPLLVEIRGKTVEAVVVPTPFYKRES